MRLREVLGELNRSLGKLYASEGRPIPPEQLLSALLLQVFRAVFFRSAAAGTLDWGEGQPADVSLAGAVHASTNAPVNYFDTPAILPGHRASARGCRRSSIRCIWHRA